MARSVGLHRRVLQEARRKFYFGSACLTGELTL